MNLKKTIRRVLKEESRFKKFIYDHINEFGIYDTAKMMAIPLNKLVEITEHPIDSEMAYVLLINNLENKKLTGEYRNFKIYSNFDGVVSWEMNRVSKHFLPGMTEQILVAATPFWDGKPSTPVEIDWFTLFDENNNVIAETDSGGEYIQLKDKTSFNTLDELFEWYEEYYLPEVYSTIMGDLMPNVYQEIKDKLDDIGGY